MKHMTAFTTTIVCLFALGQNARGDEAKNEPVKATSVEGITEYRLSNGLKVLLFPDPSKSTVTVNITYRVGSRHEGYGETGMAHLLEHLVFKGTPTHPAIWKEMQDHGANFNGTTSYDRTNYFETVTATDENLEWALGLEADRMINSHIARKDLDSEFSVVRNEFEMGENNPVGVLEERVLSTAYLWHNYGKSTIGSREDIERVPIDRLQAFYKKYYQPDNAMLVVAGKFDEAKTLDRINALFGSIPKPQRVLDHPYTVEPPQDGEREVTLRRVGDVQAVQTMYHICSAAHEDMPALQVLADIAQATQTGRLYKTLVETQMATRVSASAEMLFDPGVISFGAEVPMDKSLDAVRKTLIDVVEGLAKQDISAEEVGRAKNAYAKGFDQLVSDTTRVAIGLTNWESRGDWRLMFLHRDRMKKVTPGDVKRVAGTYLKSSNRTTGVFIPEKAVQRTVVAAGPDLGALLKDYKGDAAVSAGEAIDPTPAAIEARVQRGALPCGIKTALLPKKSRGQRVNLELHLHYGSEALLKGRVEAASMVAEMLERGTAKYTRRQIADELDKLKATVNFGNGGAMAAGRAGRMMGGEPAPPGTLSVSIETTRQNLPAVLNLAGDMLRESNFPAAEFDNLQKQRLAAIERGRSEPTMLASNAMRRKLAKYDADDIRYVPTIEEQIARVKKVTVDDVKKVHAELMGASFGELAAVGDFDPAELTAQIDKMLAGWKTPKPYERIALPHQPSSGDQMEINTPDKAMALVMIGASLDLRDDDADFPAAQIGNMILGSGGNSRLLNRLRQKEGFSYTVRSNLQVKSLDRSAGLSIFANCAPANAPKCADAAREEIARLLKEGITAKELEDAKNSVAQQLRVTLSSDDAVTGMLVRQMVVGRTMKFIEDRSAEIQSLTVEQVNAALRKYVSPDKQVLIKAGDFGKS